MQNTSKEMTKQAVTALEDKKAENIKIINIETVSTLADYFIIAGGSNRNQVQAMCDNVEEMLTMLKNACFLIFVISTQMWYCLTKIILHLPCRIFIVQKKFHLLF